MKNSNKKDTFIHCTNNYKVWDLLDYTIPINIDDQGHRGKKMKNLCIVVPINSQWEIFPRNSQLRGNNQLSKDSSIPNLPRTRYFRAAFFVHTPVRIVRANFFHFVIFHDNWPIESGMTRIILQQGLRWWVVRSKKPPPTGRSSY